MKYTVIVAAAVLAAASQAPPRLADARSGQAASKAPAAKPAAFDVFEASIPDMQAAMKARRTTSHAIVQQYLTRIATYEDLLHAAITVNPKALQEADERDRERAQGRIRGPLHGIPIALKDNIHTTDMRTTGGALAFEWLVPPYEATLTRNLKDAGAIIIAKTGLTELANYVAAGMPTNYNAVHGYGMNPYDPRRDPRSDGRPILQTGGSSSGVGTAANFWAGNVGTETSGSILSPTNQNMLAAIKPTVGRISRYGVIPITADQDTPGPMAKYVSDIAIMFGALEGAAPDPNDPATRACTPPPNRDYTKFLKADGLKGARIGIPRKNYYEAFEPPVVRPEPAPGAPPAGGGAGGGRGGGGRGGLNAAQKESMDAAIAALKTAGAIVIDVDIPSMLEKDPKENLLTAGQSSVLSYGMKRDFNTWLASLGPAAPVKSLTELREWNTAHERLGAIKYGQSQLDASDRIDLEKDRAKYQEDRARDIRVYGKNGIDAALKANNLDALLFPGPASAGIASKPGYPTVLVPFGMVPNLATNFGGGGRGRGGDAAGRGNAAPGRGEPPPGRGVTPPTETAPAGATPPAAPPPPPVPLPPGFDPRPQPFGVAFTGTACSEAKLLQLAYAFEQATKKRTPPPGLR